MLTCLIKKCELMSQLGSKLYHKPTFKNYFRNNKNKIHICTVTYSRWTITSSVLVYQYLLELHDLKLLEDDKKKEQSKSINSICLDTVRNMKCALQFKINKNKPSNILQSETVSVSSNAFFFSISPFLHLYLVRCHDRSKDLQSHLIILQHLGSRNYQIYLAKQI